MFKFKHATKKLAALAAPAAVMEITATVVTVCLPDSLLTSAVIKVG